MAIKGQASRLVVASMNPDRDPYNGMTYAQYLQRMGEKFSPAAESMQMEAEYKARKQGKMEDVQNYINAKHELFQLARPNALPRDTAEFYQDCTEGLINCYVRDQMFCYEAESVEAYGARAVRMVQVERRRVKIGDSDSRSMAGLVPVTRAVKNQEDEAPRGVDPMEVDALYGPDDYYDDLEPGCECVALHEGGFQGPCFFCQKQGPSPSTGPPTQQPART